MQQLAISDINCLITYVHTYAHAYTHTYIKKRINTLCNHIAKSQENEVCNPITQVTRDPVAFMV